VPSENPADDLVCIYVEAAPMTEQDAAGPPCVKFRDGSSCLFSLQEQRKTHPNCALLPSALENLLQNAFKFTPEHTEVKLTAYAAGARVLIDVSDHCGGLSAAI
jgi:signal transduction histidine kinase